MKRIAVFGAHQNVATSYKQAKDLGYYIVAIASPISEECRALADVCYKVSFADIDQVTEICKKEKVDGITSFTLESALPFITQVATRLGLNCNSMDCVERVKTKYTQRETMLEAGVPTPRFCKVLKGETMDGIAITYPCIVKPIDSGGSQGITKLSDSMGLNEAITKAQDCSRTHGAIIEDFIDGREFSVEYLSYNGKHYFCQLTDKVTSGEPLFVEIAHHQPADVSEALLHRIQQMVEAAITALKIENSPSHTEIKLNSKNELYIIEIGARMGGGFITEQLVKLSTGIDFVAETLNVACRTFSGVYTLYKKYAGVYHYSLLTLGIGRYIDNPSLSKDIIKAVRFNNDLTEVHSNADRSGYLLYQSDDAKLQLL